MSETKKFPCSISLYLASFALGIFANLSQAALFRFFMGQFYGTEIHLSFFLSIWLTGIAIGGYFSGKTRFSLNSVLIFLTFSPLISLAILYYGAAALSSTEGAFISFGPLGLFMAATVIPLSFGISMFMPIAIRVSQKSMGLFYSSEAFGGFLGGIFFSLLIGGKANSTLTLLILPLLPLSALFLVTQKKKLTAAIILLIPAIISIYGPEAAEILENSYWQKFHPLLKLEKTVETPYQKLQLASYHEMKSLYANGILSDSWPLAENAESRVHQFISSLKLFKDILVIGAPTSDIINEFFKYPDLKLTIVESDEQLIKILDYSGINKDRIMLHISDPRSFLNHSQQKFDGIFITQVSPVTLSGNRLFTIEAFKAAAARLNREGVLQIQVAGGENYVDPVQQKIIASGWHGMSSVFPHVSAIPGSHITFLGSFNDSVIPANAKAYAARFAQRNIQTTTFQPMSFYNLLMPFRVEELQSWLTRDQKVELNSDMHPGSFLQQLELWNIYSDTALNHILEALQKFELQHVAITIAALTIAICVFFLSFSPYFSCKTIIAGGVAVSGASGLLCEIILILVYQNRFGAAYQMTALFFGVYMFGLASGSRVFGRIMSGATALKRLKVVKLLQIVFTVLAIFFIEKPGLHNALSISIMIFIIAFLDGVEFPVADSILRSFGREAENSAGLLLLADNSGALAAGLLSGLWLLPAFGMQNSIILLTMALCASLTIIMVLQKKLLPEN